MVTEVNVNKCTINDLFVQYVEDRLYVNRKYQRKLVWNIYDKKLLIDSIIRGVPLPTLLLSEYKENEKTYIEIADGMQRTEAMMIKNVIFARMIMQKLLIWLGMEK